MFLSLFRIVARKLLVRKGRLIVAACLFLLGVVGTFYFRADSKALIFSGPARTLRVVSTLNRKQYVNIVFVVCRVVLW